MFIICPYCGVGVDAATVTSQHDSDVVKAILRCPRCKRLCFAENRGFVNSETREQVWHIVYPVKPAKEDPAIPAEIQRDYNEAVMCHSVGAYRATAAMCRRALQASAVERGASRNKLVRQIDELRERDAISAQLAAWAHEIRFWGNIGAHPDQDGLQDITAHDASDILRFTEAYLEHVYLMPARIAQSRRRREPVQPEEP